MQMHTAQHEREFLVHMPARFSVFALSSALRRWEGRKVGRGALLALVLGVGAALLDPGLFGPIVVGTLGLLLLVTAVLNEQ